MRYLKRTFIFLLIAYVLLLIPLPKDNTLVLNPSEKSFVWDQDKLWNALEQSFIKAKETQL